MPTNTHSPGTFVTKESTHICNAICNAIICIDLRLLSGGSNKTSSFWYLHTDYFDFDIIMFLLIQRSVVTRECIVCLNDNITIITTPNDLICMDSDALHELIIINTQVLSSTLVGYLLSW